MNRCVLFFFVVGILFSFAQADDNLSPVHVGCFKDSSDRSLTEYLGYSGTVVQCVALATAKGYKVIGIQNGGECWSSASAAKDYNKQGPATNCNGGVGGAWANDVYDLVSAQRLSNLKGQFNALVQRIGNAKVQCIEKNTPWNDEASAKIAFLDRHDLSCPDRFYLARFVFRTNGHKVSYLYRCCEFVL